MKKNNPKGNKWYVVIALLVIIVIMICVRVFDHLVNSVESESTIVNSIPVEYMNLFLHKDSTFSKIKTYIILKNQRSSISNFLYDDKYYITVTKLKTTQSMNSLPLIQLESGESEQNYYGLFNGFDIPYGEFDYRPQPLVASNIFLTLYGDSLKQFSPTNYLTSYSINIKKFSVKYIKNGPVDLYMDAQDSQVKPSSILLFFNYHGNIYLIYIVGYNATDKLNLNIVNKIIKLSSPTADTRVQ
jgi:hypothetical protein